VSGGWEKKIRRWRVKDGKEVGKPMDVGSSILDLAVTQDGRWIVCGTESGQVMVWDAKTKVKVTQFNAHDKAVNAVDISADGTKIATGSDQKTFTLWSFSDGKRLIGPFEHDYYVVAVKFSPDGRRIATVTCDHSVRIYDNSDVLADFPIRVHWLLNQSLAWASDSNRLCVLSEDGDIHSLDVSTKKTIAMRDEGDR
jgi:WD40 repeat protein